MRDLHSSKYAQAIPGLNRIDEEHKLSSAESRIQHFGDGLSMPDRLLATAALAHQGARLVTSCFESMNLIGEQGVEQRFSGRDSKVRQWSSLLNAEVDSLAKEISSVDSSERDTERRRRYLMEVEKATEATRDFRRRIPDKQPDDPIDRLLEEEKNATRRAELVSHQNSQDLQDCRRSLEMARRGLMSEVEAKSLTLNVSRRCQNSEPLLSFPYRPSDHPIDQIYHPNTEEDWERNLENKLQDAVAVRRESSSVRLRTASALGDALGQVADSYAATTRAIEEEVQRDERTLFDIRNTLEEIGKEILWTKQRAASLLDNLRLEERGKTRQLWRLQTLTYRPGNDHIRDAPARKCDEELLSAEQRAAFASDKLSASRDLLARLQHEKDRQTVALEKIAKKLFVERENCLGIRRTVKMEGRN